MAIEFILENYRANAGYEFYENYGLELSYSQPIRRELAVFIKI
jgi:hypothetical protein